MLGGFITRTRRGVFSDSNSVKITSHSLPGTRVVNKVNSLKAFDLQNIPVIRQDLLLK